MPPKRGGGTPQKKKKKQVVVDPAEEFWVTVNTSVLSRSRLPEECSMEVDVVAPQYDARPGVGPNGTIIRWGGLSHRTEKVSHEYSTPPKKSCETYFAMNVADAGG